jgi:16S rRNA processing protein RimM
VTSRQQHFQIGYVTRPRGLKGEVGVRTFDPHSETLLNVSNVRLRLADGTEQSLEIDRCREGPKEFRLQFRRITSRAAAESLIGAAVCVDRLQLPSPEDGEFFQADLVGLNAVTEDGRVLGMIKEVLNTGPVANLVIGGDGEELLIPFADEFVPRVDMDEGRVIVRLPEYTE